MSLMNTPIPFSMPSMDQLLHSSVSPRDTFITRVRDDTAAVARRRRLVQLNNQVPVDSASDWVKNPLAQIAELPYLSASLSVVDSQTVFVRICFPNEVDADIQYHSNGDAFVALYRNDRSVFAGSGTIPAVVTDLHGLLRRV